MLQIAGWIDRTLSDTGNDTAIAEVKSAVETMCESFPIYAEFLIDD